MKARYGYKAYIVAALLAAFAGVLIARHSFSDSERYSAAAYHAGKVDARNEVARGVLAIEEFGKPVSCYKEYDLLLRQNYGIEVRCVAGCVVDDQIVGHAKDYNEIARAEIEHRFGKDIWDKAMEQARKTHSGKESHRAGYKTTSAYCAF